MNYCRNCVLPDTRPNLQLDDDGICNACRSSETKSSIDWGKRKKSFELVVKSVKAKNKGYDCLIPVSGGKDSHWQVIKCLEYGLNPLAVTWKTPARTEIGTRNLENLINLGVDHIDFQINNFDLSEFIVGYDKNTFVYDLYGVCNHGGGTAGGHYTSYVKNSVGDWYHYNDTLVNKVSENNIKTPKAYCFFYRKKK